MDPLGTSPDCPVTVLVGTRMCTQARAQCTLCPGTPVSSSQPPGGRPVRRLSPTARDDAHRLVTVMVSLGLLGYVALVFGLILYAMPV